MWLILFTLLSMPVGAFAQHWPSLETAPDVSRAGGQDVAVLVGIEDYVFVPKVAGAKRNINEWEVFLHDGLGVPHITTLLNEQATREEVLAAAERASALAGPDSTVWFVFVGHGAPSPTGDGLLLGVDAQQTALSLSARGVPRAELVGLLEAGTHKRTVVLLDACFSGIAPDGTPLVAGTQPVIPIADPTVDAGTVVLGAAQANEVAGSLPGLGRPAFSYLVLGGLRGWASGADGDVSADEAVSFARRELLTVPGRRQTPTVVGLTDTVLAMNTREARPGGGKLAESNSEPKPAESELQTSTTPRSSEGPLSEQSRLFASMGLGAGAEVTYETGLLLVDARLGLRMSRPSLRTQFGLVASIGYANVTNVYAREVADEATELLAAADVPMDIELEHGKTSHMLILGSGPSLEVGQGALRFFGDLRAGLALPLGGECRGWSLDESGTSTRCTDRETDVSPAGGARLGVSYKFLELAAQATYMPRKYTIPRVDASGAVEDETRSQTLFVAGLTAGVRFDL